MRLASRMRPLAVPLFLIAWTFGLALIGCGGAEGQDSRERHTATLGPEGGVLRVRGGELSIPQGALSEPTEISLSVSRMGAPEVPERVRVTEVFHLSPMSLRLLRFATLSVDYLPERLPGVVHASQFDLRRTDSSQAQERLNGVFVDTVARRVNGEVLQFGVFWGTVPSAQRPAKIAFEGEVPALSVGETFQIEAYVLDQSGVTLAPEAAGLTFSSSDARVVSVDGTGLLTANAPGLAQITASAGAASALWRVSVRSDAPIVEDFAWENPAPQGNSLTAVTRDASGAIYVAAMGGAIWRRPSGGRFELLHTVADARFLELSVRDGRLVAVGRSGTGGILLTLDGVNGGASALSARTIAVAGSSLTRLFWEGERGVATGEGDHLLLYDAALDAWQAVANPSFDRLLAGGFDEARPQVLTSSGLIYERVSEGWSRVAVETRPGAALIDGVALAKGGFAAIDEANRIWRFDVAGGWREVSLLLEDDAGEDLGESGEGEGAAEDGGDGSATSGDSGETEETPEVEIALTAIGHMGGQLIIRAVETPADAPSLAREVVFIERAAPEATAEQAAAFARLELLDGVTEALWAADASDLVAVGTAGAVQWWHEGRWTALSKGETGWIIALSAFDDTVYALVERCLDANCFVVENRVLARTESGLFEDVTPDGGFFGRMRAMGGKEARDLWVMGEGGLAYRRQDGVWSSHAVSASAVFAIEHCGEALYAAGLNGALLSESEGLWTVAAQVGTAALRDLGCAGDSLFAVGDYQILTWIEGRPVSITPNDDNVRTALWKAVLVTPDGRAFIGGDARYILFWNGTNFEYFDNPAGLFVYNVRALHGTSYSDVWAAGTLTSGEGFLVHFNGAEWRSIDPVTVRPVLSIAENSAGTFWIGGGNGSILRGELKMNAE